MPANLRKSEDAVQEGVRLRWLSTIVGDEGGALTIERMELDESGLPRPTGDLELLGAEVLVLALGQEADLSLLRSMPAVRTEGGLVSVGSDLMSDHPGVFAGGDMVAGARTLTDAVGHGKKAARAIDAWLDGRTLDRPGRHAPATPEHLNTWYYSDAPQVGPTPSRRGPAHLHLRRGGGWARRVDGPLRGTPLPVVRQLLPMRQLFRSLPRQRGDEGRRGPRIRLRLRLLQGLRAVRPGVPLRRDRDGAEKGADRPEGI